MIMLLIFERQRATAFVLLFMYPLFLLNAQQCDRDALTAKYWQYRQNFNKHFVVIDRDPDGCVHDGIGQDPNNPCICSKAGYSLPATSIQEEDNGGNAIGGERNYDKSIFYDFHCADNLSNPTEPGFNSDNTIHNSIEFGSETPHQLGWYWITLATEYALLKQNGQNAEATRTLEELFLALQAYKRLDIQANCLVKDRYDEITNDFEVEFDCKTILHPVRACLCGAKYRDKGGYNFDSPCKRNCPWQPRTDGLSGFFVREDATQELENFLHDPTEAMYNVDAVNSAFALSNPNACSNPVSRTCYMVHTQNFMSQDQLYPLILGLAFIKRYIPENAVVTTCENEQFNIVDMAKQIAGALTDRIDNETSNLIVWPGSHNNDCCDAAVSLKGSEGGHLQFTMKELKKACNYIDGGSRKSNIWEAIDWGLYWQETVAPFPNNGEGVFFWKRRLLVPT